MQTRRIEITLAALIAGTAMFTTFVPGASSDTSYRALSEARPTVSLDDFKDLRMSNATRNVASAVLEGDIRGGFVTEELPGQPDWAEVRLEIRDRNALGTDSIGSGLGFQVRATSPLHEGSSKWWIVGGAGQETYAVSPNNFRDMTLIPVSVETTIGDAHVGVGYQIDEMTYASIGYVREERSFDLGTKDWEEEEHFLGVSFRKRW